MPDLIRHPETYIVLFPGFRLVGRNDKSLRDNQKLASPKNEAFQPSPKETLNLRRTILINERGKGQRKRNFISADQAFSAASLWYPIVPNWYSTLGGRV